ncbi:MAG: tRNA (5-methylaminomethyl-2-thiouridine)(34)-methyltransferase MnmD [Bacteroidetes bacterium]|nr:tRNA (5-methylaminomethyl-2-thiouridine)(34)-methyltransferase MnmD [Bacteroidota bacterium]
MNLEPYLTSDGSYTLINKETNCAYHSLHGAVTEGKVVFINYGLNYAFEKFGSSINLLEVGFGAGLHTYLTLLEASNTKQNVFCTSIEINPVQLKICEQLNYEDLTKDINLKLNYKDLINAEWNKTTQLNNYFSIQKLLTNIYNFEYILPYHVVYYSGFSHTATPEVWEKEIFEKMFKHLPIGACVVTHCAKGVYKRMLKEVGFTVETLKGPPRKNEVTRAIKI